MRPSISVSLVVVALAAVPIGLLQAAPQQRGPFTVTSTTDAVDANPGDGVCETAPGNDVCTLRGAIQESNALQGPDVVVVPAGTYSLTLRAADDSGGDLDINTDMAVRGAGASRTIVAADGTDDRVIEIGEAPGIENLDVAVSGLTVRGGQSTVGGGVYARASGRTEVMGLHITANQADLGGGVYATGDAGLQLMASTVSGNTAEQGGGVFVGAVGPAAGTDITTTLSNDTISGNQASDLGGGVAIAGRATLIHTTVTGNTALTASGVYNGGDTSLANSIVARNGTKDCDGTTPLDSQGGNVDGDSSCNLDAGKGDRLGVDPRLQGLGMNGGETPTHALGTGSPAIDAGTAAACLATDQRGAARPFGARCDAGAVEQGSAVLPTPTPSQTPQVTATPTTVRPTSTQEATSTSITTATPTSPATPTRTAVPASPTATRVEPTSTSAVATPTPGPSATPMAGLVCSHILGRVPMSAINEALADPASVYGYGELCFPNKPESPYNARREWLTIQNPALPYHPLYNRLVYRCGCP